MKPMKCIMLAAGTICLLAMSSAEAKVKYQCRSSITGKVVPTQYAKAHPDTTQCSKRKP
jgi:hypothetical protein